MSNLDFSLVNEISLTQTGNVTSIRWLPKGKQNSFVFATSNGECGLRNAEDKKGEIIRLDNREEYLALDVDNTGKTVAIADKSGNVALFLIDRSFCIS